MNMVSPNLPATSFDKVRSRARRTNDLSMDSGLNVS